MAKEPVERIEETFVVNKNREFVKITPKEKFQLIDPELYSGVEVQELLKKHGKGPFEVKEISRDSTGKEIITAKSKYDEDKEFKLDSSYAMVYYGT